VRGYVIEIKSVCHNPSYFVIALIKAAHTKCHKWNKSKSTWIPVWPWSRPKSLLCAQHL